MAREGASGGLSWIDASGGDGTPNLSVDIDYGRFDVEVASTELAKALEGDQEGAADFEKACVMMAGQKCRPGDEKKRGVWLQLAGAAGELAGPERYTAQEWQDMALDALDVWSACRQKGNSIQALQQAEVAAIAFTRARILGK